MVKGIEGGRAATRRLGQSDRLYTFAQATIHAKSIEGMLAQTEKQDDRTMSQIYERCILKKLEVLIALHRRSPATSAVRKVWERQSGTYIGIRRNLVNTFNRSIYLYHLSTKQILQLFCSSIHVQGLADHFLEILPCWLRHEPFHPFAPLLQVTVPHTCLVR